MPATPVIVNGVSYPLPDDDQTGSKVPLYNNVITALAGIESGVGTAFPSSPAPATNDRFYRSDRDIEYKWNGTRWLSTQLFTDAIPPAMGAQPYAATVAGAERLGAAYATTYDLWLVEFQLVFYVVGGTALSGSHKWVTTLTKATAAGTATVIATVNIDSGAVNNYRTSVVAIGALLGVTHFTTYTDHTKTGTPGNLFSMPRIVYRLVG